MMTCNEVRDIQGQVGLTVLNEFDPDRWLHNSGTL
jgi:hypothetical protein